MDLFKPEIVLQFSKLCVLSFFHTLLFHVLSVHNLFFWLLALLVVAAFCFLFPLVFVFSQMFDNP